jgi:hypothetical protein
MATSKKANGRVKQAHSAAKNSSSANRNLKNHLKAKSMIFKFKKAVGAK